MKWMYSCPLCQKRRTIEWKDRKDSHKCHNTKNSYIPPSPSEQHSAYVDTHKWPKEMEDVVVKIKGKACTVPGCKKDFETLDHRVPWSMSGNTSVDNLFPMCESHNLSKGDTDYQIWFMFKDD